MLDGTPAGNARGWLRELAQSLGAIVLALLAGAALLAAAGYSVRDAYWSLYQGAFGNVYSIADTLLNAIPLLFTGLAVALAFRGGLFNIGTEGQMYAAALATALTALALPGWPPLLLITASLLAGAAAGAAWGFVPGFLRARTGAHEVITTIMLNYVAILLTTHLVKTRFKAPGPVDQTALIPAAARLPELVPATRLTWAIVVAVALIALVDWVLRKSSWGMDLELVGQNPSAAAYAGVPVAARTALTMAASGAIAGLAGSTLVLGVLHRFITHFSPGYGFTGIAVALAARARPWGVVPAALLFGALQAGGLSMQLFARIPADLITVIQGLVILFVAAPGLAALFRRRARGPVPVLPREGTR
ncbi:MAG TPA: ABC transporter permease [Limnochordales bacterium]|nr:ABC transporter permease [Limnochordales bacterium]